MLSDPLGQFTNGRRRKFPSTTRMRVRPGLKRAGERPSRLWLGCNTASLD